MTLPAPRGAQQRTLDVLRQQFAPNAGDDDLSYFAQVSRHMGVDPWAGHICLIPYAGVWRPQLTVAGRRYIAQRTGRLRGIVGPQYCGPRSFDADGAKMPLEWVDVWDDDETPPYAARVLVYVEGWEHPSNGTTKWAEFVQTTKDRRTGEIRTLDTWARMPAHMLGKCAESLALRRAFSEVESAVADLEGDTDRSLAREVDAESFVPPFSSSPDLTSDRPALSGRFVGQQVQSVDPAAPETAISAAPPGGDPAPSAARMVSSSPGGAATASPASAAELQARTNQLSLAGRQAFGRFRRSRGWTLAEDDPRVLAALDLELRQNEVDDQREHEAYS